MCLSKNWIRKKYWERSKDYAQQLIKLIASASLLTKILANFLFGLYLLN